MLKIVNKSGILYFIWCSWKIPKFQRRMSEIFSSWNCQSRLFSKFLSKMCTGWWGIDLWCRIFFEDTLEFVILKKSLFKIHWNSCWFDVKLDHFCKHCKHNLCCIYNTYLHRKKKVRANAQRWFSPTFWVFSLIQRCKCKWFLLKKI